MKTTAIFALIVMTVTASAQADTQVLRCEGDLVQTGKAKMAVVEACGAPVLQETFCKPGQVFVAADGSTYPAPCQLVEQWTYNPGSGQFYTLLQFEEGIVTSIRFAGRVP